MYFFHVPARTDLQTTTITPVSKLPEGKGNINKSEGAPEGPPGDVKVAAGDSPKAEKLVGPDKTLDTSGKDNGVINNDKPGETGRRSDENGDVNNNNNLGGKIDNDTPKETPGDTKQPENPVNTNIENPASSNTDNGKREASIQSQLNENALNELTNEKNDEGVKKRAAGFKQRLLRKHSRNI